MDIAGQFQQGLERGRAMARERAVESALRDYSLDPNEPMNDKAVGVLAAYAPERLAGLERIRRGRTEELIARQQQERRARFGSMAAQDPQGAARAALTEGDFDLAKAIREMAPDQAKLVESRLKAAAPFAYEALKLPDDASRKAYIQSNRAVLEAGGWSPQEIDAYTGDAATLKNVVTGASTLAQLREQDQIQYREVGPGARLVPFDSTGRPLSADTGGVSPSAAPSGRPVDMSGASDIGSRFGRVTSVKRSPEHNRKVGGVANSYHLSGHAVDIARGPGVTHAQIEQAYRDAGYKLIESLDEGDHSHFAFAEGGGKPKTDLAKVRADAEAAIAAGADPAKVKARAAEMGVTL